MEDPSTKLPQELLDHIIDELSSDRTTLERCAISFQALRLRSQSHLFAKIHLDEHVPLACKRLHSILTENASITSHVHKLTVSLFRYNVLTDDEVLPLIFDMLTSLRAFWLFTTYGRTWTSIPERTKLSLFQIFALPSLSTIHLTSLFDIPTTFFNVPNTLEQLILDRISFDGVLDLDNSPSLFFRALELRSLPRRDYDTTRHAIIAPKSCLLQMSELCSKLSHDTLPTLVHVLKASAPSLTSIKLSHTYSKYASPGENVMVSQFRLPGIKNLQHISFTFRIYYSLPAELQHNSDVVIQQLISFLAANADAVRSIETLTMTFTPLPYLGAFREDRRFPNLLRELECWNDLDRAVYSHCVLPGLRVGLVLLLRSREPSEQVDRRNEWRECMPVQFPLLRARGALVLDTEDALGSSIW
ncbi:hypothetical protein Hypma_002920 [Hypsizygus marmoreus]|uniref:F-box domain-containing protein n=1 Tax=Hypsizygus marmoreus TaxID=39966 RepID=A0A369JC52_HYPMA|nr:hypothetical protein Hypma_002920 [Hypsizygus marmoreus]